MGTTVEKLTKVLQTKEAIRTSINNKGGTLTTTDTFASYPSAIDSLPSGGGITKRELVLNALTDFTDITQTDQQTTLQFTETGSAKVKAFVEGITKNNVVSLYCSIYADEELIPGITEIGRMYGTFDIPGTGKTEGMPGLSFNFEPNLDFLLVNVEGTYTFIMVGSSGTTLSKKLGSLSLTIFYLQ